MLNGIDVSSNNEPINWQLAASAIQFALVKASEGVKYVNEYFTGSFASVRQNGILPATYHFGLPAWNAPADEAAHFIQTVRPYLQPGDVLALDMEPDPYGGTIPDDCGPWALAWLQQVEAEFGCKPLLYTNLDMIQNHGLRAIAANNNGLWLADPGIINPPTPAPWPFTAIQQTSWAGAVPGVPTKVDKDIFFGDAPTFQKYGIVTPQKLVFDEAARLKLIGYIAGGSGVVDLVSWLGGYQ